MPAHSGAASAERAALSGETQIDNCRCTKAAVAGRVSVVVLMLVCSLASLPGHAVQVVPDNWSLKPAGLGPGDRFRLLFVAPWRSVSSTSIRDYNSHVRNAAKGGHHDIRSYHSWFGAYVSTPSVHAMDNTDMRDGTGVPIYWLNGARVAKTYEAFTSQNWSNVHPVRNQWGAEKEFTSEYEYALSVTTGTAVPEDRSEEGRLGMPHPIEGFVNSSHLNTPIDSGGFLPDAHYEFGMYAVSGVFEVGEADVPRIESVTITSSPLAGGRYLAGESIQITLVYSEAVSVTGAPQLAIRIGAQNRVGTYTAGASTPTMLRFEYTVSGTDYDGEGISVPASSLDLNGGTIKSTASDVDAALFHRAINAHSRHKVGEPRPGVVNQGLRISSQPGSIGNNMWYGLGESIEVEVTFSEPVVVDTNVSPLPYMNIDLDPGSVRRAGFVDSLSDTKLRFAYTVIAGDWSPDGIAIPEESIVAVPGAITGVGNGLDADLRHGYVRRKSNHRVHGDMTELPAHLTALSFSDFPLTPEFDPSTQTYESSGTYSTTDMDYALTTVTATAEPGATAVVDLPDASADLPGHQVKLRTGRNTVTVTVTRPTSIDRRYTVHLNVTKASITESVRNNNWTLSGDPFPLPGRTYTYTYEERRGSDPNVNYYGFYVPLSSDVTIDKLATINTDKANRDLGEDITRFCDSAAWFCGATDNRKDDHVVVETANHRLIRAPRYGSWYADFKFMVLPGTPPGTTITFSPMTDSSQREPKPVGDGLLITVPEVNATPVGAPRIEGAARVHRTLTADLSGITDDNGLVGASFSYQWIRVDGGVPIYIPGETDASYTLTANDEGKTVKVKVTFTDDGNNREALTSDATDVVLAAHPAATITGVGVRSTPAFMSDTYGGGETIEFLVTFDHPVEITGTPYLQVQVGDGAGTDTAFEHVSGDGATEVVFGWTVPFGVTDSDGIGLMGDRLFVHEDSGAGGVIGTITTEGAGANLHYAALGELPDHKILGVPRAVTGLSAAAGPGSATLGWALPGPDDGYDGITGYQYRTVDDGVAGDWQDVPQSNQDTVSHVVTGLHGGIALTFEVRAVSQLGGGPASAPVQVTPFVSSDASVAEISLVDGNGADVGFATMFAPDRFVYDLVVGEDISLVTLSARPVYPGTRLDYGPEVDADLFEPGHQVRLEQGVPKTIEVSSTAQDEVAALTYSITVTRSITGVEGICERTLQVKDAIVSVLQDVEHCTQVTEEHLAAIGQSLDIGGSGLSQLMSGDFAGLSSLTGLDLHDNVLVALPPDLFDGVPSLETLDLGANKLSSLSGNALGSLPLTELRLHDNEFSAIPDGLFAGLSALESFTIAGNLADPLPLTIALVATGNDEYKAVAPTGAPFALTLPLVVANGGVDGGGGGTASIAAGAFESAPFSVSRAAGSVGAVTVDFGTMPDLPAAHAGYALTGSADLPVEAIVSNDATLGGLSFADLQDSEIALTPAFGDANTAYSASVANAVSMVTVLPELNDSGASVTYDPPTDADPHLPGHQVSLAVGANTIAVTVTAADGIAMSTYTTEVTRNLVPTVTISAPFPTATYEVDSVIFEVARSGATTLPLVVQVELPRNFIKNANLSQSVTILEGESSGELFVSKEFFKTGVSSDGLLTASVTQSDEYEVGSPSSASVTMVIADPAITVRMGEAAYAFGEDRGGGEFTVLAETAPGLPKPTDLRFSIALSTEGVSASDVASATAVDDFTPISSTVVITEADFVPEGNRFVATSTHSLDVVDDGVEEPDEQLWLALKSAGSGLPSRIEATLADGGACNILAYLFDPEPSDACGSLVTITDELDPPPDVAIAANHAEIGAGLEDLVFTLTRPEEEATDALEVTVALTQDETWLAQADLSHEVTFRAGNDTATLTIAASDFSLDPTSSGELAATVSVDGREGDSATVEVISVEGPPVRARLGEREHEFSESQGDASVDIVLEVAPGLPRVGRELSVTLEGRAGTAVSPDDYLALSLQPTFGGADFDETSDAGGLQATETVSVELVDDEFYEGEERFKLRLAAAPGTASALLNVPALDGTVCTASFCSTDYPVTLTDEEDVPVLALSADPATIAEADDGDTPDVVENVSELTVTLTNAKTFAGEQTLTLSFAGTAEAGTHYEVAPADADPDTGGHQVTLAAGAASVTVTVSAVDNATADGARTIEVTGAHDGTQLGSPVTVTIADDDVPNTAPTAADGEVTTDEDTAYEFAAGDFNFADADTGDALASVTVVTLPAAGKGVLALDGAPVTADQSVAKADLDADKLVYTPPANANGEDFASFTFRVSDGTDESALAYTMTVDVTAVNDAATGQPTIGGTVQVGQTLTADLTGIGDVDGRTKADNGDSGYAYAYQWLRVDGGTETAIASATGATYTLTAADAGKSVAVRVTFTDDVGTEENVTSDATAPVVFAGALVLNVDLMAGDGTVNIAEKASGFTIGGDTAAEVGVSVTVEIGSATLDATSADESGSARWSVSVPAGASYITGTSVDVSVEASKTGFRSPAPVERTLGVDLAGPTAPAYTVPSSLRVGKAIAAMSPTGGADIAGYGATGLPSGLVIDTGTGVISGTPDTADANVSEVTVTVSDAAGNAAEVALVFPAVDPRDTVPPVVSSAAVDGAELVITFDEDLAAAPNLASGAFAVKRTPRGGSEQAVALSGAPAIGGATVTLRLAQAVVSTDAVTVGYTKPDSGTDNRLEDAAGNEVADFADQPVTNNTPNAAPTVANAIPDQRAMADTLFRYPFPANTFHDADSDMLTYTATQGDGAALPAWLDFIPSDRTFTGTPAVADAGTLAVKVTAQDSHGETESEEFTLKVAETDVCARTPEVRDAIVSAVSGVTDCADVTLAHLAGITGNLDVSSSGLASLQAGDFAGLTGLTGLFLYDNSLTELPAGVFDQLTALTSLRLHTNSLTALPAGLFDELTALEALTLSGNMLSALPANVFDNLTALRGLSLNGNRLTELPAGVFDELTALTALYLQGNSLTALPAERLRRAHGVGGAVPGRQQSGRAARGGLRRAHGVGGPAPAYQPRRAVQSGGERRCGPVGGDRRAGRTVGNGDRRVGRERALVVDPGGRPDLDHSGHRRRDADRCHERHGLVHGSGLGRAPVLQADRHPGAGR